MTLFFVFVLLNTKTLNVVYIIITKLKKIKSTMYKLQSGVLDSLPKRKKK